MNPLAFRQVHLDFHTSEQIAPICEDFDAEEFARTLAEAHVNSVTCFSRCHHGMIYHDTRFEARHPGLSCNLLGEQIEACHRRGIRVPVYISVGLDEFQARRRPEWLQISSDGRVVGAAPLQAGWRCLCFNSPYIDYVIEQTREVLEIFEVDGLFFDIIHQRQCCCRDCLDGMRADGLDPEREEDRTEFSEGVISRFRRRMMEAIRDLNRDCTIFFNQGHVAPRVRHTLDTCTHLELESLPGGLWGYDHFPLTVRFARNLGLDTLGMTGKFHKSWADFGGFKNQPALACECFGALAEGSKCSVGDQLHPTGRLDPATYELIGSVYAGVEEKEPWCEGAEAVAEIAVFTPEALGHKSSGRVDPIAGGALRMLLEAHHQFDLIDEVSDWSRYRVVILPDVITLDEQLAAKAGEFVRDGGAMILSHRSGLDRETGARFVLDRMPAEFRGEARFSPDFLEARAALAEGILRTQHVMYDRGMEVEPLADAEVLADVWWPYFNRTWAHFCSHFHTPPEKKSGFPAVVQRDRIIYFVHPVFGMYRRHGARTYRQLVVNALARLLPEPLVVTNAPSTARVTLLRQAGKERHVLHLLHYIPEHRCDALHTIEDVIPLHNVRLGLALPKPGEVYLAPSCEELEFEMRDDRVWLTVPQVKGHAMVVLEEC